MSLRPAQDLVAETSKFSLRNFFEKQQQEQQQLVRSPAELPIEGLPTLNSYPEVVSAHMRSSGHQIPMQPHMRLHGPTAIGAASGGLPPPKDGKFTFTGLMSVTTPIQAQHKILQQHQQQAAISAKHNTTPVDTGNDMMRLKAHVVSLNERLTQANANLSATSESVVRGNKALTTERAQFHSKYASLTKKLESIQKALAEAEALPKEDVKNTLRLNARVMELEADNENLVTTRAALQDLVDKADATNTTAMQLQEDNDQGFFQEQLDLQAAQAKETLYDQQTKFTDLAAQHSVLLDEKIHLERELEGKEALIDAAEVEVTAANDRAAASGLEVAELLAKVDASQLEIMQTDSLVDQLDAKLADARTQVDAEAEAEADMMEVAPTAGCCLETARCEEMENAAQVAQDKTNVACAHDYKRLHNEWQFIDSLARRARHSLTTGEPERVIVSHIYTGRCDTPTSEERFNLALHIGANPLTMGKSIDASYLHCPVATDAGVGVQDTLTAEGRTNAFVQAVSKDLKFSMDGSQALYASSATTGSALRI